jgi:putative radical SAM enzyme (TIGR03279 family)
MTRRASCEGIVVERIRPRSPAAAAGLLPGDRLLAINGVPLRDAIDFHFQAGEKVLRIDLDREGRRGAVTLVRRWGRGLGLELSAPQPGEIITCANKCVFCFVHQLPRGMRKSLYVKDNDYRLSFLHGNYVTLTDLPDDDIQRIIDQRLSPLYVSVHATDPDLRHRLLGEPRTRRDLLPLMERLAGAGITMHAQIVLCPTLNDGPHLERSVRELAALHPGVATVAVVPVGLTRHRDRLPRLRSVASKEASEIALAVKSWQGEMKKRVGTRFVYLADEFYLAAGIEPPPARHYEGFPLIEDGVGLVRRFTDGFLREIGRLPRAALSHRKVNVVTGTMFAPRLASLLELVRVDGIQVSVVPVANDFFGHAIGVAGLLTGRDILNELSRRPLADPILVPAVALREGDGLFLDDFPPKEIEIRLGSRVKAIDAAPRALLNALLAG